MRLLTGFVASVVLAAAPAVGGGARQSPATPDSPDAKRHVMAATKAGATDWAEAVAFFCDPAAGRANSPTDPELTPTRIFDNLYVIGRTGTAVYAITTREGIVLIDAGYADQIESVLLPGLKQAGLDPAQVKYVIVGHGHADHFGGAAYLQERYGARVVMAAADWDLVERPAAAGRGPAAPRPPVRDVVASEGQAIVLGEQRITPVFVPGHTPGSLALLFEVRDGQSTHVAALFGGTVLIPGRIPTEGLQQYVRSIRHFADVAKKMKADVEVQNHPLFDGMGAKLQRLRERRPGGAHPFVVGQQSYQNFLTVMSECMSAQIARRAQG